MPEKRNKSARHNGEHRCPRCGSDDPEKRLMADAWTGSPGNRKYRVQCNDLWHYHRPHTPDDGERAEERIARAFHSAYESLAPEFDYETRPESRVQLWADVPEKNRALMVGTVRRLIETGVICPASALEAAETRANNLADVIERGGHHTCQGRIMELEDRAEAAERRAEGFREALERITQVGWPSGSWGKKQREAWEAASTVVSIARSALQDEDG